MLAQRLRHRVEFQSRIPKLSPSGQQIGETWATATVGGVLLSAVPAEVLTGAGRETIAADAKQGEVDARITVRWFPGLSENWRIRWDGKDFDITGIETDLKGREWYRCTVRAGADGGN